MSCRNVVPDVPVVRESAHIENVSHASAEETRASSAVHVRASATSTQLLTCWVEVSSGAVWLTSSPAPLAGEPEKPKRPPESSHHYGAERGSGGAGLGRAAPGRTAAAFWSEPPPRLWRNDVIDDSGRRALRARPVPVFITRQEPTIHSRCLHERDRGVFIPDYEAVSGGGGEGGRREEPPCARRRGMKAADGRNETAICKAVAPGDE